jgi:glycosyltransferase involved in cell wall biosynthesis
MEKVLIIIPAFNEEANIGKLFDEIEKQNDQFDILVINDCSKDGTSELCRKRGVNVIDLPVNLGIGGAVQTGYKYALKYNYDVAVQVDGDGQHDPFYIGRLVNKVELGSNMCIGSRYINKEGFQSSLARRIGIKHFSRVIFLLTKQRITDPTSGARACDKNVIKYFASSYPKDYPEPETIISLLKMGCTIAEIPVKMNERKEGKSSITNIKALYYMIKVTLAMLLASIITEK